MSTATKPRSIREISDIDLCVSRGCSPTKAAHCTHNAITCFRWAENKTDEELAKTFNYEGCAHPRRVCQKADDCAECYRDVAAAQKAFESKGFDISNVRILPLPDNSHVRRGGVQ